MDRVEVALDIVRGKLNDVLRGKEQRADDVAHSFFATFPNAEQRPRHEQTFETAIIERYRRRESSVEEALIEMHLARVSVRRVEDITEAGLAWSPSTVSDLNKEDLHDDQGLAQSADRGEAPLCFHGRHRAQATGGRSSQYLPAVCLSLMR